MVGGWVGGRDGEREREKRIREKNLFSFPGKKKPTRKKNQKPKKEKKKHSSHLHAHLRDGVPGKLHRLVGPAGHPDLADDLQDQVLGGEVGRHLAVEDEAERRRHLDEELARAEDEAGVGVADARGELAEGARVAGVLRFFLFGREVEAGGRERKVSTFFPTLLTPLFFLSSSSFLLFPPPQKKLIKTLTESVPSSTSPGRQWPSCASATWQTPVLCFFVCFGVESETENTNREVSYFPRRKNPKK